MEKKVMSIALIAFLLGGGIGYFITSGQLSSLQNERTILQGRVQALQEQINQLQSNNTRLKDEVSALRSENTRLSSLVSQLQNNLSQLQSKLKEYSPLLGWKTILTMTITDSSKVVTEPFVVPSKFLRVTIHTTGEEKRDFYAYLYLTIGEQKRREDLLYFYSSQGTERIYVYVFENLLAFQKYYFEISTYGKGTFEVAVEAWAPS
jgi:vacuolar-type H+-ATPase subunit I/STV1